MGPPVALAANVARVLVASCLVAVARGGADLSLSPLPRTPTAEAGLSPSPPHRTPQAASPPYKLVGTGDCLAPGFRPMRGRSRRDISHGRCRASCVDHHCVGYTYSPCQQLCSIHGDPEKLQGAPQSDGWKIVNGGGHLEASSGLCGSACYLRMGPCPGGSVLSSRAPVAHGEIPFGGQSTAACPRPFRGVLKLGCGIMGVTVVSGRCLRPCLPGTIIDRDFRVDFPPIRHGDQVSAPCPGGSQGAIVLRCIDETVFRLSGRCGYNCPPGGLKAGEATVQYPAMAHDQVLAFQCPAGFSGQVGFECVDSIVGVLWGRCDADCLPGRVPVEVEGNISASASHGLLVHGQSVVLPCSPLELVAGRVQVLCISGQALVVYNSSIEGCQRYCPEGQVAERAKAISHGVMLHGVEQSMACMPGSTGQLLVRCDGGATTVLEGRCNFHCQSGTVTSNSVTLAHGLVHHGEDVTLKCPSATHAGELDVRCTDGAMRFNGTCNSHCVNGSVQSNGALVNYSFFEHGVTMHIDCPYPWGSSLTLWCYDGTVRQNGSCGWQCKAGVRIRNGAAVNYEALNHSQAKNYSCASLYPASLTFSGQLSVGCYNGKVSFTGECWPDCPASKIMNNGANVFFSKLLAGDSAVFECSPSRDFGTVLVSCVEGIAEVSNGTCGAPCYAGKYSSQTTRFWDLAYTALAHNTFRWESCPGQVSGRVRLFCHDGAPQVVEGGCGERCPAQALLLEGASFATPQMDHGASFHQPCLSPYTGSVLVHCNFGVVNATNRCMRGCFAANVSLPGGVLVQTPDFIEGSRPSVRCPDAFAGAVTLRCVNGTPQAAEGSCDRHCEAGRLRPRAGADWDVPYYEMPNGSVQERRCPQGMSGSVALLCDRGRAKLWQGGCYSSCPSGRAFVRQGIIMRHAPVGHGRLLPSMLCPAGFAGSVRLKCFDGEIGVAEGRCFEHCPSGGVQGALFGYMLHGENASLRCPTAGLLRVGCFDGHVHVLSGQCLGNCEAGQIPDDQDNISIAFGAFGHGTNYSGTCVGAALGHKSVSCNNGNVTLASLPGEQCYRHCRAASVNASDGSPVQVPATKHGQRAEAQCPNGERGLVVARCFDGSFTVTDGRCGSMNCGAGLVASGAARLQHGQINNGRTAGPSLCPAPYIGQGTLLCRNGSVEVSEVTLVLPPWDISNTDSRMAGSPSNIVPIFRSEDAWTAVEDYRFELCECCLPQDRPQGVERIMGVDNRVIVYWAAATAGGAFILAAIAGCCFMRKRKSSHVAPEDVATPKTIGEFSNIQDMPKQDILALKRELRDTLTQKQLMEDLDDVPRLTKATLREEQLRSQLARAAQAKAPTPVPAGATAPSAAAAPGTASCGLEGALHPEDSPAAPRGVLSLKHAGANPRVAQAMGLVPQDAVKKRACREQFQSKWRHW